MRSTGAQVGDVGYVEPAPNRVGGVSGCNGGAGGFSVPPVAGRFRSRPTSVPRRPGRTTKEPRATPVTGSLLTMWRSAPRSERGADRHEGCLEVASPITNVFGTPGRDTDTAEAQINQSLISVASGPTFLLGDFVEKTPGAYRARTDDARCPRTDDNQCPRTDDT
jgi:hypothetical protein